MYNNITLLLHDKIIISGQKIPNTVHLFKKKKKTVDIKFDIL